ncbi:MAG: hypothetical protein PHC68_07235 [Syntrophorhabdaceae bacterium]|nr:hypothetical protein [Syntrophorhabdaceae bacterium]
MKGRRSREVCNGILIQEFFDWPSTRKDLPRYTTRSLGGKKAEAKVSRDVTAGQPTFISNNDSHVLYSDRFKLNRKKYGIMMTRLRSLIKTLNDLKRDPANKLKSNKYTNQWAYFMKQYGDFYNDMVALGKTPYNQVVPFFNMGKLMGRGDRSAFLDYVDKILILHGIKAPAAGYGDASENWQKVKKYVLSLFNKGYSVDKILEMLDKDKIYLKKGSQGIKRDTIYSWRREWKSKTCN